MLGTPWSDAAAFCTLLLVNVHFSTLTARRWVPAGSIPLKSVVSLLVFWSVLVVLCMALSQFSLLSSPWTLPALTCAIGVLAAMSRCKVTRRNSKSNNMRRDQMVAARVLGAPATSERLWGRRLGVSLSLILAAAASTHTLVYGILQLPVDWDSLAYHLPLIDHWIQSGTLWNQDCAFWYVPGNNELLGYYFACGFEGDYWVQVHNLIPGAILLACLIEFTRELRISWQMSIAMVAVIVLIQPVIRQLISAENDLGVVALFVSTALFGWRYVRYQSPMDLICLSMSIGLLGGTKYYALAYSVVGAAIPALWLAIGGRFKASVCVVVASIVGFIFLGGFWYYRNWAITGTPLFPKGFFDWPDIWSEIRPNYRTSKLLRSGRSEVWPLLARAWLVHGGVLPVLLIAVSWVHILLRVLLGPDRLLLQIRSKRQSTLHLWLAVFSAAACSVYLITPNVVETQYQTLNMLLLKYHSVRFGLCVLALSGLAIAGPLDQWILASPRTKNFVYGLILTLVLLQLIWQSFAVFNLRWIPDQLGVYFWWAPLKRRLLFAWALLFVASVIVVFVLRELIAHNRRRTALPLGIVFVIGFTLMSREISRNWHERFLPHFDVVIHSRCVSHWPGMKLEGDRLCVYEYRYYPFLGSRREHSVCRPLWHRNSYELRKYLLTENASVVLLPATPESAHIRYRHSRAWYKQQVEKETNTFDGGRLVLVRVPNSFISSRR